MQFAVLGLINDFTLFCPLQRLGPSCPRLKVHLMPETLFVQVENCVYFENAPHQFVFLRRQYCVICYIHLAVTTKTDSNKIPEIKTIGVVNEKVLTFIFKAHQLRLMLHCFAIND